MNSSADTIKTGAVGVLASLFTWVAGAMNWYITHLSILNDWLVHLAQIGGLVVVFFSIKILHRNWKTGSKSRNPLD